MKNVLLAWSLCAFLLSSQGFAQGPGIRWCNVETFKRCDLVVQYLIDIENEPIAVGCGACTQNGSCPHEGNIGAFPNTNTSIRWIDRNEAIANGNSEGKSSFSEEAEIICGMKKKCTGCVNDEELGLQCDTATIENGDYKIKPRKPSGNACLFTWIV